MAALVSMPAPVFHGRPDGPSWALRLVRMRLPWGWFCLHPEGREAFGALSLLDLPILSTRGALPAIWPFSLLHFLLLLGSLLPVQPPSWREHLPFISGGLPWFFQVRVPVATVSGTLLSAGGPRAEQARPASRPHRYRVIPFSRLGNRGTEGVSRVPEAPQRLTVCV